MEDLRLIRIRGGPISLNRLNSHGGHILILQLPGHERDRKSITASLISYHETFAIVGPARRFLFIWRELYLYNRLRQRHAHSTPVTGR